jgi:hypothetical protein
VKARSEQIHQRVCLLKSCMPYKARQDAMPYGGLQDAILAHHWRAYEDQPFRATDASCVFLDVDLTLPSLRAEAQRADTNVARGGAAP